MFAPKNEQSVYQLKISIKGPVDPAEMKALREAMQELLKKHGDKVTDITESTKPVSK